MDFTSPKESAAAAERLPGAGPLPVKSASSFRDLRVIGAGSVTLLVPLSADAADWLREECQSEPWQWRQFEGGDALVVEPDCADEIVAAWEVA